MFCGGGEQRDRVGAEVGGGRGLSIASIVLLGTGRRATSLGPWGPGGMGDLVSAGVGLG